jgi:hypothetical protein
MNERTVRTQISHGAVSRDRKRGRKSCRPCSPHATSKQTGEPKGQPRTSSDTSPPQTDAPGLPAQREIAPGAQGDLGEQRRVPHDGFNEAAECALTEAQASKLNGSSEFHSIECCGGPVARRVLTPTALTGLSLAQADFYCAPCLRDVRYREATGEWHDITEAWSRLRDIRVKVLLALQLSALPIGKATVARLIGDSYYEISGEAYVKTISVLRTLIGGGSKNSRFIATHPGRETAYSWRSARGFIWVTLEPLTLPGFKHP